jgi:hypothetical protein
MNFIRVSELLSTLSWPSVLMIGALLLLAALGTCIAAYVAMRGAFDTWRQRKADDLRRDQWLAEQERIHRGLSGRSSS